MNQLQLKLKKLEVCKEAIEWCKDYNNLQDAWNNCKRSDWMLWLIDNQSWGNDKQLRLMAVDFAGQVQHLMKDERSIQAIDVAERYANGDATDDELNAANDAAWAAAAGAAWAAAAGAARDAASDAAAWAAAWDAAARDAAWAAAWAAAGAARDAASDAASWAAAWDDVAAAGAAAAAWAAAKDAQSDIIRKWFPTVLFN